VTLSTPQDMNFWMDFKYFSGGLWRVEYPATAFLFIDGSMHFTLPEGVGSLTLSIACSITRSLTPTSA
jgi:hypothetical protein